MISPPASQAALTSPGQLEVTEVLELIAHDGTPIPGEIVDADDSLAALAVEVASRQGAPLTRRTYAGVYRAFCAQLEAGVGAEALTPQRVRAYRDALEASGRSPATIAKHLSALRALASALGVDGIRDVRGARVARGEPRPLTADELARLLRMPDRRTVAGRRDLALLHLLATAGLRRAEACAVRVGDVDEHRRVTDGRLQRAIPGSTSWWVTVAYGKRGRRRRVPLEPDALDALTAWFRSRPTCSTDALLVSLSRSAAPPRPLTERDVGRIVGRHAAAAGLPEDRRTPHVLRHTFCTHLADGSVPIEVIAELAGHADVRTTSIYAQIADTRLEEAIVTAGQRRTGLARLSETT